MVLYLRGGKTIFGIILFVVLCSHLFQYQTKPFPIFPVVWNAFRDRKHHHSYVTLFQFITCITCSLRLRILRLPIFSATESAPLSLKCDHPQSMTLNGCIVAVGVCDDHEEEIGRMQIWNNSSVYCFLLLHGIATSKTKTTTTTTPNYKNRGMLFALQCGHWLCRRSLVRPLDLVSPLLSFVRT